MSIQFVDFGTFYINPDEIVCIYTDETDVHLVLKHPLRHTADGIPMVSINLEKTRSEADRLLAWARQNLIPE